jgi:hypothetical protein
MPPLTAGLGGDVSYVRLRGLTVRSSHPTTGDCILDSSLGAGGGYNEFVDLTVTDCGNYAWHGQKPYPLIDGGTYSYCGDDCIAVNNLAVYPTIRNATIEYISTRTATGDGIAVYDTPATSDVLIEKNRCYWDFTGLEKQCFIVGVQAGTVTIRGNSFVARVSAANNHAIAVTAATNAYVEHNYCDGWEACVTHFNVATEGIDGAMYVRSNVAKGSQYAVLFTPSVGTPSL